MGDRSRKLNVSHSLSADAGLGDLNAASVTDHAFIADLLILSAIALPILLGTEDPLAEQAVSLRLEGPVVDRLGLCHLAMGPLSDLLRRSQSDLDRFKSYRLIVLLFRIRHLEILLGVFT